MTLSSPIIVATFRHPSTLKTVQKMVSGLEDAIVAHPEDVSGLNFSQKQSFSRLKQCLVQQYLCKRPIIVLCATGIVVRILAPYLQDKYQESPVIVVAEDGSSVIPLLGSHRGGNVLSHKIGSLLGIKPSVTTASDLHLEFSLDQPPEDWNISNPEFIPPLMKKLLSGEKPSLWSDCENDFPPPQYFSSATAREKAEIVITHHKAQDHQLGFHPQNLALGIGCERHCAVEYIHELLSQTLDKNELSLKSIACIATVNLKADEPALHHLSDELDIPIHIFSASELEDFSKVVPNPSDTVFVEIGTHSVAEAAALAVINSQDSSDLIIHKQKNQKATLALAYRGKKHHQWQSLQGRTLGSLNVVGIGPGDLDSQTFALRKSLLNANIAVGYDLYLDLISDLIPHTQQIRLPLGKEKDRAEIAIEKAQEGSNVALVCSGDPGIYALATLVHEVIAQNKIRPLFRLKILPGITAMQAAAAKLGAPMGHDFLAISLSDLLTPKNAILSRLKAAAEGDFVVSIYNPQSKTRRSLLAEAKRIFLSHRPKNTPVAICRNIGRSDEKFTLTTLNDFDPEMVDMLCLVMIGSSMTRLSFSPQMIYTPRGYIEPTQIFTKG